LVLDSSKESAPLYIQLKQDIKRKIENGILKPGDRIPSEKELCEMYNVSRITVREAINELVWEEYLIRKRPKGTFVLDRSKRFKNEDNYFTYVRNFTYEMKELGKKANTLKADISLIEANEELSKLMDIHPGSSVYELKRVRGNEDAAIVYFKTYITCKTKLSLNSDDYYGSLYEMLKNHGIKITKIKEYIEAVKPTQEVVDVLHISFDTPVLKRVRKAFCKDKKDFMEYTECYYIGDKYRYYIDLNLEQHN